MVHEQKGQRSETRDCGQEIAIDSPSARNCQEKCWLDRKYWEVRECWIVEDGGELRLDEGIVQKTSGGLLPSVPTD